MLGAASPKARGMPYAAGKTGKSPSARDKYVDYVDNGMKEQCDNCLGIFLTSLSTTLKVKRKIPRFAECAFYTNNVVIHGVKGAGASCALFRQRTGK